jgi:hypothetical protein
MSKTTTVTAILEHKEEKVNGTFTTVKLTLVDGLQKDVVDCHPAKAEKVNVGDSVVVVWVSKYREYQDKVYETKQVAHIETITASSESDLYVLKMPTINGEDDHSSIASDDIPF